MSHPTSPCWWSWSSVPTPDGSEHPDKPSACSSLLLSQICLSCPALLASVALNPDYTHVSHLCLITPPPVFRPTFPSLPSWNVFPMCVQSTSGVSSCLIGTFEFLLFGCSDSLHCSGPVCLFGTSIKSQLYKLFADYSWLESCLTSFGQITDFIITPFAWNVL